MTSKERAKLKSAAANTDTIFQIGKNPLSDSFVKQVRDALAARELIKIRVLETCEMLPEEFAAAVSEAAGCEVVQVIGSRVVLFKKRSEKDKKPSLLAENVKAAADNSPQKNRETRYAQKGGGGSKRDYNKSRQNMNTAGRQKKTVIRNKTKGTRKGS